MRRTAAICCLALTLLALAACGGSDDEQRAVRAAIRTALTSTSPAACTRSYTRGFLDQGSFGLRPLADDYARFCRANIDALAARAVAVSDVSVDGARARARFTADGGAYAVRAATVELRKDGGRWRLDRLTALTLDRARFARQQARATRLADGVSRRQSQCVIRRLGRVSDAGLEAALVHARAAVLADPLLVCAIRPELLAQGLSQHQTRCVIGQLRREPEAFVRRLLERTAAARRALDRAFTRAGAACR